MFDTDIIEANKDFIEKVIKQDRERFREAYMIILRYIGKNNIVIGGKTAVYAMVENKYNIDKVVREALTLELFCSNINHHGTEIAMNLFRETNVDNCYMRPTEDGCEVHWNQRKLVMLNSTSKYEGLELIDIMRPKAVPISDFQVRLLSPEILLISLYRQLIQPEFYESREELQDQESKLYAHFIKDYSITGSAELDYNSPEIVELKQNLLDLIYEQAGNTIKVGKQAIEPDKKLLMLHIASDVPYDRIEELASDASDTELFYSKFDLSLPIDFRLRRFRISIKSGSRNLQLIDIFNAPTYDLVVDHPYLWLRFLFVEIWSVQLLRAAKYMTEDVAKSQIVRFVSWVARAHTQIEKMQEKYDNPEAYLGHFLRDSAARSIAAKNIKKKFISFYPAAKMPKL